MDNTHTPDPILPNAQAPTNHTSSPPKRVQDDFGVRLSTYSSIDELIKEENEKNKPKSKIWQFFAKIYEKIKDFTIWGLSTRWGRDAIRVVKAIFDYSIKPLFDYILDPIFKYWVKPVLDKIVKPLFTTPGGRVVTIIAAGLILAGFVSPLAPVLAPALASLLASLMFVSAIVSLVGVGLGIISDTIVTRNLDRLKKKASFITELENIDYKKQYLRKQHPIANTLLAEESQSKIEVKPDSIKDNRQLPIILKVGKFILEGVIAIFQIAVKVVKIVYVASGIVQVTQFIVEIAIAGGSVCYKGFAAKKAVDEIKACKEQIKSYNQTHPYNNSLEAVGLRTKQQRVEMESFNLFAKDTGCLTKDLSKLNEQELVIFKATLKQEFAEYKAAVTKLIDNKKYQDVDQIGKIVLVQDEIKKIKENQEDISDILTNYLKEEKQSRIRDYGKSFLAVNNPFHRETKYVEESGLVKVMKADAKSSVDNNTSTLRKDRSNSLGSIVPQDVSAGRIISSKDLETVNINLSQYIPQTEPKIAEPLIKESAITSPIHEILDNKPAVSHVQRITSSPSSSHPKRSQG